MTLDTTPAQTVLFHCVEDIAELDELLDRLESLGLVLAEIHEAPATPDGGALTPPGRNYEVRVLGEVGERLLRSLGWSYRHVPEQQLVWGDATPDELSGFLLHCVDSGLGIERVHRVPAARSRPSVSRGRTPDPDAPPPCGG
jgi:hypothetical protein